MDVEMQAPHGDAAIMDNRTKAKIACCAAGYAAALVLVILAGVLVPTMYFGVDTHYSVAIDSVSGLDPAATGLSFNLTLTVASRSHSAKACVYPGMYAQVFYRGVQLASSEAESQRTCARPRNVAQLPVVAKAIGVPVGNMLESVEPFVYPLHAVTPTSLVFSVREYTEIHKSVESLEADMRQGTAVFDVRLGVPAGSYGGIASMASWFTPCKGTRVGDPAVMCEVPDQS